MFLNLTVKKTADGLRINFFKDEVVCESAQESLILGKSEIDAVQDAESLTADFVPSAPRIDTSGPQLLSCAAILAATAEATEALLPNCLQLNWCHVEEPEMGSNIFEKTKTRIWYQTLLRDFSGSVAVSMSEKAALALSGLADAQEFASKHEEDAVAYPLFCSVRITREVQLVGTEPNGVRVVRLVVADACVSEWKAADAPNASNTALLDVLQHLAESNDGILCAQLREIRHCPHYGLAVEYPGTSRRNGKCVAALIASSAKSRLVEAAHGHKVLTDRVQDALQETWATDATSFGLVGYCSLNNVLDFKLDPPRAASHRYAVVLVSAVSASEITIDFVQPLDASELATTQKVMGKLRRFCMRAKGDANETPKRNQTSFNSPPVSAKKARTLGVQPTDASLEP